MSFKDSTITQFSPPGNSQELTAANQALWSKDFISQWMSDEKAGKVTDPYGHPRLPLTQLFNPQFETYDDPMDSVPAQGMEIYKKSPVVQVLTVSQVALDFGTDDAIRWHVADSSRAFQDEYLEWSLNRDDGGYISSVTFTCEGPEYWQFFMACQQTDGVAKIRELNGTLMDDAEDSDLFIVPYDDPTNRSKWVYNPRGDWNFRTDTGTISHLIHPSNTLSAEIDIAAQGTVLRTDSTGKLIVDSDQLINCSRYGNPSRNSDPRIGATVNAAARQGLDISIADPVALYMNTFETSSFQLDTSGTQSGDPTQMKQVPDSWYEFQRGDITKFQGLRLRIRNNSGTKAADGSRLLTVSDVYDSKSGNYIQYGAQFADYVTMGVAGVTKPGQVADAQPCIHLAMSAGVSRNGMPFAAAQGSKVAKR
ncbi:hypothetical protein LTR85_010430 [Meristemomyces frigidus]|nr:hypothetical protein LTR85_010430 [Meristemomyces frigidus]